MSTRKISKSLTARLARVRIFLCDVDGILTDGTVSMGLDIETKRFCLPDGLGIRMLRRCGLKVGWISGRPSPATEVRARELEVDFLHQGRGSKVQAAEDILARTRLTWEEVCYMGDDIVDLGMLKRAGVAVAVPQAMAEAKALAHYVTQNSGGQGAVREMVELILKAQDKWHGLIQEHSA